MTNKAFWVLASVLAAVPAASVQGQGASAPGSSQITKEQAEQTLAKCGSYKFTAQAEFPMDGAMKRTGLTLCSSPGETEAMWIAKLERNASAVATQPGIPDGARAKLAADIRGEVARLRTAQRRGLPAADALVANVPSMPAPLPPKPVYPVGTYVAPSLLSAPNVTIRCLNEGGQRDRGEDCEGQIRRETILALESGENMSAPATVRFLRKGQLREEVSLGALRQGQLVRMRLPRSVCKGVVRSELQVEVVSSGNKPSAAMTGGPYDLRC